MRPDRFRLDFDALTSYIHTDRYGFRLSHGVYLIALPALVYYLWVCVSGFGGALVLPASKGEALGLVSRVPGPTAADAALYAGWLLLQALLQAFAPGRAHEGALLADGTRLKYRMNGWFSLWATLGLFGLAVWLGWVPATLFYDHFGPLLTVANILAFGFSLFLYFHGRARGQGGEVSGRPLYDYFMGTSLNPRIGDFDLKLFCEARPSLILWVLIDLSLAAGQYQAHGGLTTPMILVVAFQFLYVADYFFHESAILTTLDVRHERFGWMLCWGNLVWVPFAYSLQAHYLVRHTHDLPAWGVAALVALNGGGYYIFRSANNQKHRFRADPEGLIWGKRPDYIRTRRGPLLLTSGWWGVARHCNYAGDLLMGLAWCLPCLFDHLLSYFYILSLTLLLVHRERRDHALCLAKYGEDWDAYCRRVRWRILPGLY
jgi:hypothetical protein